MECLESRYLLSGLVGLLDPNVPDESWETPAVVLESKCTAVEVAEVSPAYTDDPKTEGGNDATDELACKPDGDAGDQQAVAEKIEDVSFEFADSAFVQRHASNDEGFYELTLDSAPAGDELIRAAGVSSDTEPQAGLVIPQPATGVTSATTPRHPVTATANTASLYARPSAPSQQPVYFSGSTTLSRARWQASAEKLADADALLEGVELEARENSASPDTIAAMPQAATSERSSKAGSVVNERTVLETAFSQVHWWTEKAELSPARIAAVHEFSGSELADKLVEVSLTIASDADDLLDAVASVEAELAAKELATANIAPPIGRVQGWHVLGGIGVWQVVLSVRARHRKQTGENLA
jgi:hypothetical protein